MGVGVARRQLFARQLRRTAAPSAYYYHNYANQSSFNHEDAIKAILAESKQKGIPFRYVQVCVAAPVRCGAALRSALTPSPP